MIRLLVRTLVFFGSSAVGLLVAAVLLDDVKVRVSGFLLVVVIIAAIQSIASPLLTRVAARRATTLLSGVGLLSTFVALVVASVVGDSLTIEGGVTTWLATTAIVWLATAAAALLLPFLLVRAGLRSAAERRDRDARPPTR